MKKWTYLVAAGMLLGAAPVFTGCIDNDEPEGITGQRIFPVGRHGVSSILRIFVV